MEPSPLPTSAIATPRKSQKIKIYIDSVNVPGWNEIDAVGIVDDVGAVHWAVKATASSTYAEPEQAQLAPLPAAVLPPQPPPANGNDVEQF